MRQMDFPDWRHEEIMTKIDVLEIDVQLSIVLFKR